MKYTLLILLSISSILGLQAQQLAESRQSSPVTLVYRLSDHDTRRIYKSNMGVIDDAFFHTLFHSYHSDSIMPSLPPGNYLLVKSIKGELHMELHEARNVIIEFIGDKLKQEFIVLNARGEAIEPDKVYYASNRLTFNRKQSNYRIVNLKKSGFVRVEYEGHQNYFPIWRSFNGTLVNRAKRRVIYSFPIKYTWTPFRDIYRTARYGYPHGFIERVGNLFDPYSREYSRKYRGFVAFNQPKYKPGDTVKVKAFITNRTGKPVHRPLDVRVGTYRENKVLEKLEPYRKGGYTYSFVLDDKVGFKLDQNINVSFEKGEDKDLISRSFNYEDYELKNNMYSVRSPQKFISSVLPMEIYLEAKDANDMNLMDAKARIVVRPSTIHDIPAPVFIADTLWVKELSLDAFGETKVIVPPDVFPFADFDLNVSVDFFTSDGDFSQKRISTTHRSSTRSIVFNSSHSALNVLLLSGRDTLKSSAVLYGIRKNDTLSIEHVTLPYTFVPHAAVEQYLMELPDGMTETYRMSEVPSRLSAETFRSPDSLHINVLNPRGLLFWYSLYEGRNVIEKGYTDSWSFQKRTSTSKVYTLAISYVWAGVLEDENFTIPFYDKLINLEVSQPTKVYPGQEVTIYIRTLDQSGQPVADVDITAFGQTNKFKMPSSDEVPYLGRFGKSKKSFGGYNTRISGYKLDKKLQLDLWRSKLGLDTVEYYRFLNPVNNIYIHTSPTTDSSTLFSPFYINGTTIESIKYIELDNQPIYFEDAGNVPYSFFAPEDMLKHTLQIRTANAQFILRDISFQRGMKTILSFGNTTPMVERIDRERIYLEQERKNLHAHTAEVDNNFSPDWAYLKQGNQVQLLHTQGYNARKTYLVGPFRRDSIQFKRLDAFAYYFHFQPGSEYQFHSNLIRERVLDDNSRFKGYLHQSTISPNFHATPLTETSLLAQFEQMKRELQLRERFDNPRYTQLGNGQLIVKPDEILAQQQSYLTLLQKHDDPNFLRIYYRRSFHFHDLEEGLYQVLWMSEEGEIIRQDSMAVFNNGVSYFPVNQPAFLDSVLYESIKQTLETELAKPLRVAGTGKEVQVIRNATQSYLQFGGQSYGSLVSGRVTDESGEGLPGVNVVIQGTTSGVTTDLDGYYSISVPSGAILVFSSVGMSSQEVIAGSRSVVDMAMTTDVTELQEVVVVGYGSVETHALTSSISTLQGRAPGVQIQPGAAFSISLRGANSFSADSKPLVIVDGVVVANAETLSPDDILNMEVLKDEAATALYGSRAADGVVIITTKKGPNLKQGQIAGFANLDFQDTQFSLRDNFSDYAWWQPNLRTNRNGEVSFKVTFPDDVTTWKTVVKAINGERQSGEWEASIKSFKDLMASLNVPRFLVTGDTTYVIGKVLNYTSDTLQVKTEYSLNGEPISTQSDRPLITSIIDDLKMVAHATDSIKASYKITHSNGYMDGEERKIPVFRRGTEEAQGWFRVLASDTTFTIHGNAEGQTVVTAQTGFADVLKDEIEMLRKYPYDCNEQIASRLIGLLAQKTLDDSLKQRFKFEVEVKGEIEKLIKNQKKDGTWGWWPASSGSVWVTEHVVKTLSWAEKMGYRTNWNKAELERTLDWEYPNYDTTEKFMTLEIMSSIGLQEMAKDRLVSLEKGMKQTHEFILTQRLRARLQLKINIDSLINIKDETALGGYYWSADSTIQSIDNLWLTHAAFEALYLAKADQKILNGVLIYLAQNRSNRYWMNTYQSSRIIAATLPYVSSLLANAGEILFNNKSTPSTHYTTYLNEPDSLVVSKTGQAPVYLTSSTKQWIDLPKAVENFGTVTTSFDTEQLQSGKPITLKVALDLTKEAEYCMIEVPIPAGCSYESKEVDYRKEEHREYYMEKANIYVRRLSKGKHTFEIKLLPRYAGSYHLNPAKVELMYFPTFFNRNEVKQVKILEQQKLNE